MKFTTVEEGKYSEYLESISSSKQSNNLILLFYASLDQATGRSWCGDCRDLDPVIESLATNELKDKDVTLVKVYVGQKHIWKDPKNFFKQCDHKITAVPTLINTKTVSIEKTRQTVTLI